MDYKLVWNSSEFQLPAYNVKIANILQNVANATDEIKAKYDAFVTLLGRDKVVELLGKFSDCDVNEIYLLFDEIKRTYDAPLNQHRIEEIEEKISDMQLDKLAAIFDSISNIGEIDK